MTLKGSCYTFNDFGLGPGANEIGKNTEVLYEIGKIKYDIIPKHINSFVIFIRKLELQIDN